MSWPAFLFLITVVICTTTIVLRAIESNDLETRLKNEKADEE